MAENHLTVAELAERLGVPVQTVYAWNWSGEGPDRMKIGRHVRYRLADVEKWEKAHLINGSRRGVA